MSSEPDVRAAVFEKCEYLPVRQSVGWTVYPDRTVSPEHGESVSSAGAARDPKGSSVVLQHREGEATQPAIQGWIPDDVTAFQPDDSQRCGDPKSSPRSGSKDRMLSPGNCSPGLVCQATNRIPSKRIRPLAVPSHR